MNHQIPFFPFVGEEAFDALEDQAVWLTEEIGVEFRDDDETLRVWREASPR